MTTIRPATESDIERILDLNAQGFNTPRSMHERLRREINLAHWRVAEDPSGVTGVARAFPAGQFFGGRLVPGSGIASVAVAAEARGRGVGTQLMSELHRELRATTGPIATLYPATVPLYRSSGYGYGAIRTSWGSNLSDLPQRPEAGVEVEPFDIEALDELNDAYEAFAAGENGLIRRDRDFWEKRVLPAWDDSTRYRYLVREHGRITGWIIYQLDGGKDDWRFTLSCRDFLWTTARAARTLLSLAALHRSTGRRMAFYGGPAEPLLELTNDHAFEMDHSFRTMVRLLDFPAAIEARGYPAHLETSVSISVTDSILPENNGPWRVEVSNGSAKVVPSNEAGATAGIGTWASIWASLYRARDAARAGGLQASGGEIEALEAIFAGPLPWIADFF